MIKNRTISFFELEPSGEVRLGSGNATDVLFGRRFSSPFFRVMHLEFRTRGPKWRVKLGRLRVTDQGLEELDQHDHMLAQGALAHLFFVLPEIAYAFDLNRETLLGSVAEVWNHHWFSYSLRHPLEPAAIDAETAYAKLTPGVRDFGSFVIQFAGTRAQFSESLNSFTVLRKVVDRLAGTVQSGAV